MKPFEEPTRWLDPRSDAPAELREMLAAGRDALGPTPDQLVRLGASVTTAGAGTGAAAGAGKAAAGHALTKAAAIKLAAVLAVSGAGGAVGWSVLRSAEAPPVVPEVQGLNATTNASMPAVASSLPEVRPLPPPEDDVPSATSTVPTAIPPAPVASARSTKSATVAAANAPVAANVPTPAPSNPGVATPGGTGVGSSAENPPASQAPVGESELALLDWARGRMAADPAEAMRALDEHRARFPRGTFAQEREVLAIEVLVRLGRRSEAQARAAAFASEFPGSAHRRRIAVLLGEDAGGP